MSEELDNIIPFPEQKNKRGNKHVVSKVPEYDNDFSKIDSLDIDPLNIKNIDDCYVIDIEDSELEYNYQIIADVKNIIRSMYVCLIKIKERKNKKNPVQLPLLLDKDRTDFTKYRTYLYREEPLFWLNHLMLGEDTFKVMVDRIVSDYNSMFGVVGFKSQPVCKNMVDFPNSD